MLRSTWRRHVRRLDAVARRGCVRRRPQRERLASRRPGSRRESRRGQEGRCRAVKRSRRVHERCHRALELRLRIVAVIGYKCRCHVDYLPGLAGRETPRRFCSAACACARRWSACPLPVSLTSLNARSGGQSSSADWVDAHSPREMPRVRFGKQRLAPPTAHDPRTWPKAETAASGSSRSFAACGSSSPRPLRTAAA